LLSQLSYAQYSEDLEINGSYGFDANLEQNEGDDFHMEVERDKQISLKQV
jgi:hypothetical protein